MPLLLSADFLQNSLFQKFFHEHYQSVKQFRSRPSRTFYGSLSVSKLLCKGYQQTLKVTAGKERVKCFQYFLILHVLFQTNTFGLSFIKFHSPGDPSEKESVSDLFFALYLLIISISAPSNNHKCNDIIYHCINDGNI